jgi:hypothetical protein
MTKESSPAPALNGEEPPERQARWQQSRRSLSGPAKIRMAEQIRDSVALLRLTAIPNAAAAGKAKASPDMDHPA